MSIEKTVTEGHWAYYAVAKSLIQIIGTELDCPITSAGQTKSTIRQAVCALQTIEQTLIDPDAEESRGEDIMTKTKAEHQVSIYTASEQFKWQMQKKMFLPKNMEKQHWSQDKHAALVAKLMKSVEKVEAHYTVNRFDKDVSEAIDCLVDVGNYAMMLHDNLNRGEGVS
jgi:tagatose-1,6-bisphosphate aldolase non-catalytic subunit AgaZ/GatZ